MKACEQTPSSLVVILERALRLLEGPFFLDYSVADHTWLEAARTDLRASVELLRGEPFEGDACMSAEELTAKAGLCLASLPATRHDASVCEAGRLIAEAHASLAERRVRRVMADAVVEE